MRRFLRQLGLLGLLATSLAAHSAVIQTIDLTPIDGTSISDITAPGGVRFDFGYGNGPGSVWLSSLTAGSTFGLLTISRFSDKTALLDNGDQFVVNNAVVFDLQGPGSGRGGPASFVLNVALDSGVFGAGSLFDIYSLDRRNGANGAQYFAPGAGMGAVDSHQLYSDGTIPLVADTGGVFSAASNGVSAGRAWSVAGVNSFQGTFGQDVHYGGVGFTIAVAQQIPEPSSVLLVLVSLGALVATRRRSRTPVRPAAA